MYQKTESFIKNRTLVSSISLGDGIGQALVLKKDKAKSCQKAKLIFKKTLRVFLTTLAFQKTKGFIKSSKSLAF
jgi:hypothetical protein